MIDVGAPNCPQDETNNNNTITMSSSATSNGYVPWPYIVPTPQSLMQEIIPGVFLGSCTSAEKHCVGELLQHDIRYIVCVRDTGPPHNSPAVDPTFTSLVLDIEDRVTENIIRFFPKVREFIDEGIGKNCKVLVHGRDGNSRSATLVLAYIMEKFGLTSDEALTYAKSKRESIRPNEGFVAQLIEYEPIYKARQSLDRGEPSCSEHRRQKRKCEQLTETLDYDLVQPPPSPSAVDNNNDDDEDQCLGNGSRNASIHSLHDITKHLYKLLMKN